MQAQPILALLVYGVMIALIVGVAWRVRRRRGRPGAAASATVHDMLNEDRRKAIEIIIEQRAEAQDPETADGNLPALERPRR